MNHFLDKEKVGNKAALEELVNQNPLIKARNLINKSKLAQKKATQSVLK